MVGHFNGKIEEVLQSHHVRSGEDLETTPRRNHPALQQATAAVGPGQQVALSGDEGLARTQTAAVQKAAILASGM
jgi:hypothetical protein